jgi:hypothetical protein
VAEAVHSGEIALLRCREPDCPWLVGNPQTIQMDVVAVSYSGTTRSPEPGVLSERSLLVANGRVRETGLEPAYYCLGEHYPVLGG